MGPEALVEVRALEPQTVEVREGGPCGGAGGRVGAQLEWEDRRVDDLCCFEGHRWRILHLQHAYIISHLESRVFAQCQASCFFSGPFLSRRVTFFWMIQFSSSLHMGGTEKASGMETNYFEKGYSEWSEGKSFCRRILFFEIDGRLCCQEKIQQGKP